EIMELNADFIRHFRRRRVISGSFDRVVQVEKEPCVSPFPGFGMGSALQLQPAPDLNEGWHLSEIAVKRSVAPFEFPERYRAQYEHYFRDQYEAKGFDQDGEKFMLVRNPKA